MSDINYIILLFQSQLPIYLIGLESVKKFHTDWMRLTNVSLCHVANWMKCYLNLENCWRTDPKYNESINTATLWNEAFNLSPSFGLCDVTAGDWVLYKNKRLSQNAVNIWRYAPCKGIDSHRWILDSTPWIPDNSCEFQCLSVELGFWIPIVSLIPESMSCLPDSKAKDSGFRKKFPGFRNLDSLT